MPEPPYGSDGRPSYAICRCCGTEFGYDDASKTHAELRERWVRGGMRWWSKAQAPPEDWSPSAQLRSLD